MVNAEKVSTPARRVIRKFGGLAAMAKALSYPPTTVQRWWESGSIRPKHHPRILDAAVGQRVRLDVRDFVDIDVKHDAFRPLSRRGATATPD